VAVDLRSYSEPGPLTSFEPEQLRLADDLPADPVGICTVAQGLVIQPDDAVAQGLPERRQAERSIRPVHDLITALSALDPAPLHHPRAPEHRVVGTCRHFATLSTALLRLRGVPARARCGFGTYFISGRSVDHWITEYWLPQDQRWVRIDSEMLGRDIVDHPEDLAPGQFLTGGEAWALHRSGSIDPDTFGVTGVDDAWGVGKSAGTPSVTSRRSPAGDVAVGRMGPHGGLVPGADRPGVRHAHGPRGRGLRE
jgi:Transglutaminase-like superfamily